MKIKTPTTSIDSLNDFVSFIENNRDTLVDATKETFLQMYPDVQSLSNWTDKQFNIVADSIVQNYVDKYNQLIKNNQDLGMEVLIMSLFTSNVSNFIKDTIINSTLGFNIDNIDNENT